MKKTRNYIKSCIKDPDIVLHTKSLIYTDIFGNSFFIFSSFIQLKYLSYCISSSENEECPYKQGYYFPPLFPGFEKSQKGDVIDQDKFGIPFQNFDASRLNFHPTQAIYLGIIFQQSIYVNMTLSQSMFRFFQIFNCSISALQYFFI